MFYVSFYFTIHVIYSVIHDIFLFLWFLCLYVCGVGIFAVFRKKLLIIKIKTMKILKIVTLIIASFLLFSCGSLYNQTATFPAADEIFMTSGDGDIQKPYTPLGQLIYSKVGWRIGAPILGLIKIADVDPEKELRTAVIAEIRKMGGDGLINMRLTFEAPKNGILGIGAKGGTILVTGTIIKR